MDTQARDPSGALVSLWDARFFRFFTEQVKQRNIATLSEYFEQFLLWIANFFYSEAPSKIVTFTKYC